MKQAFVVAGVFSSVLLASALTGCGINSSTAPLTAYVQQGSTISGKAMGGQSPIGSAKIYLLAVNPAGYGTPSLSLLTTAGTQNAPDAIGAYKTTDPTTGTFSVTGDYDCTTGYALGASTTSGGVALSGSEQVYLYIRGGNAGGGTNTNIGLLAALGPCNAPYTTKLVVNELTTVAMAYAFAGYATDATHISSSGRAAALKGLSNAGLNSSNLVSLTSGLPLTSDTATTRPVATLYTIANILAACVNGATSSSACGPVFQYTQSSGATGTPATDTASAAINLAHNPWPTNPGITALFGVITPTPPFAGGLASAPNDFTLGLNYTGGGLSCSTRIAIDASGNAWVSNCTPSLSVFSSTGVALTNSTGYTGGGLGNPQGIAFDPSGNLWVANYGNSSLSKFTSAGQALSSNPIGFQGGGIASPNGIAIDPSGNVWVADHGFGRVSEFNNSGQPLSPTTGYVGGGIKTPNDIALDANLNVWVSNGSSLSEFNSAGQPLSPATTGFVGGGLSGPIGLAIDATGNVWIADANANAISEFSNAGNAVSPSGGYTGGGTYQPSFIAIDSAGNAWTADCCFNNISEHSNTGIAISTTSAGVGGYTGGTLHNPSDLAIDASGDVWTINDNNSITELIGVASPVVTPVVANFIPPYFTPVSRP